MLYANYTHVVALTSSNIRTVADLRGKVVSTGSPGSGTEVIALRVIAAAGLDPARDLTRQGLGVSESADALKDGKVDAFFWSGGLPTAAIQDLSHTPGITIRLVPNGDVLPTLRRDHGDLYFPLTLPAGAYPGLDAPVPRRRRRERPGREPIHARGSGLRHHPHPDREPRRARGDSS